jgi:penicillin G amidase
MFGPTNPRFRNSSGRLARILGVVAMLASSACSDAAPKDVFPGLTESVTVRRDDFGMVHVEGANAADTYYGSGYVQTTDRLYQMELMRRRAYGRRAEVFPQHASDDVLMRHFNFPALGEATAELTRRDYPATHALFVAWTAGVNRRIDQILEGELEAPEEFASHDFLPERWRVEDAYIVATLIMFNNANQIEYDLLATLLTRFAPGFLEAVPFLKPLKPAFCLAPDERPAHGEGEFSPLASGEDPDELPADLSRRLQDFSARMAPFRPGASNNWAVDGRHTENGRPMIAGDPHQPLQAPSLFYAQHLRSRDGALDVAGFSFVGTPTVQLGHNRHIAWTATTTYPDWMDLVSARVEGQEIIVGSERHRLAVREERVVVRGGVDEVVTIYDVPSLGVVLPGEVSPLPITTTGRLLFFRWVGFEPSTAAQGFHALETARDLDEFAEAVDTLDLGAFNFIAADADGIRYRSSPKVPDRGTPGTFPPGYLLIDGDDPNAAWTGEMLPLDVLPRSDGGARGFVATANNDPFGFTADGLIDAADAFYFGVWFDPGTRGARIERELTRMTTEGGITLADFEALQTDTVSLTAERLLPVLFAAADALEADPALEPHRDDVDLAALVELLREWDLRMDAHSPEALVFQSWVYELARETVADDLSFFFGALLDASTVHVLKFAALAIEEAPELVEGGANVAAYVALARTRDYLDEHHGGVGGAFVWGDLHGRAFTPLSGEAHERAWYPSGGGDGTVDVANGSFLSGDSPVARIDATSGALYRLVASFDESGLPRARASFASGPPHGSARPYPEATFDAWLQGQYIDLAFTEDEIAARTVESFEIDGD